MDYCGAWGLGFGVRQPTYELKVPRLSAGSKDSRVPTWGSRDSTGDNRVWGVKGEAVQACTLDRRDEASSIGSRLPGQGDCGTWHEQRETWLGPGRPSQDVVQLPRVHTIITCI